VFVSFFPKPKLFFLSAAAWSLFLILLWFFGGHQFGSVLGLGPADPGAPPIIGINVFWSKPFLWFYIYYTVSVLVFYAFWAWFAPHPWQNWSILVAAVVLFFIYFTVQVSVAVNNWYGPFYDYVQGLMSGSRQSTNAEFYWGVASFAWLALLGMNVQVINAFVVQHWIFRWRTAMNDYFMANWEKLRHIEGASQRIQEDTMRFSQIMEDLGATFVKSIMTLIAFLPVLIQLQQHITELPIVGAIPQPLVIAALVWCVFGTVAVMVAGVKLPGLQFRNQRVEAAYRKELVYGEDHADRAQPVTARGSCSTTSAATTSRSMPTTFTSTSFATLICRPTASMPC
jgi:peptide/bleomycin uptake transporter